MLTSETLPAEGARYAAALVCIPGLWAGPSVWRGFGSYLGHRGWECHLLDVRPIHGGIAARGAAVAEYVAGLPGPAILLGHDAGALVGLDAAGRREVAGLVMLAPLAPGSRGAQRLIATPRRLISLVLGGAVAPPDGVAAAAWIDVPEPVRAQVGAGLTLEEAASVRDVAWGRVSPKRPLGDAPTLVVAGDRDALLRVDEADALARDAGGELRVLEGAGHWPLAGAGWQAAVGVVHRWLVQRLGAALLELYEEAMAERDEDDDRSGE
jgi:pimeloyl-ACP methyl ester carboxylesterase